MVNIVEARDLVKKYGAQVAVSGISFAVREGEIFGLLGPNGAGKTTTLSMLATLLMPTSGTITLAGYDSVREADKVKALVGIVPQELALYPTLSARDNLIFFGEMYGLRGRALKLRVDEVLEIVGLQDRGDDAIETYSGGMKRRINLAAGLLHRPKVLFLDEPTVGVDPQSRNYIFENVERLNREGMTILYTTHYMEEAERLCQRVGIMDHGQIITLDTPKNLVAMLGGGVIHIGLRGNLDGWVSQLNKLPAVKSVQFVDQKLSVQTTGATEALVGLVNAFNAAGVPMSSLEILEPNLESVFLHLTGKHLRD
jgi:ABC-2 type transport system ATP-binding protein